MKRILPLLAFTAVSSLLQAQTLCPNKAVFLVLPNQIRAYPRSANGSTLPCQTIAGPLTTLSDGNSIAMSSHGFPRVTQFNAGTSADVFSPTANGNVAPYRIEGVGENDLLSIANDGSNDFVMTEKGGGDVNVTVTSGTNPRGTFTVPGLFSGRALLGGLAVDPNKNLVAAGYDVNGQATVLTLGTSANLTAPAVLHTLAGSNTGLLPLDRFDEFHNAISVAVNPVTGEIFVYTYANATQSQQISVFPAGADGNVAPSRVISGPNTLFGAPGLKNNKIAVGADGSLYVAESNNMILVFAPGASGNAAPSQVIFDTTAPGNADLGQAGIAVRE